MLLNLVFSGAFAQDIRGYWRSADGSRVYFVYSSGNEIEASLFSSARKEELNKAGIMVLSKVQKKKDRYYEGFIHAVSDGLATIARIRLAGNEKEMLEFRLSRFLVPVRIRWYRVQSMHVETAMRYPIYF
jgi:hypothetical protein